MNTATCTRRIPEEQLAELWYGFKHQVLEKLQFAFRESGLRQDEVADRLGRQPATVNRWLRGKENMTLRSMHDLARGMNCRLHIEVQNLDKVQRLSNREHGETWRVPDRDNPPATTTSTVNELRF